MKKKDPEKVKLSEDQVDELKAKILGNDLNENEKDLLIKVLQGFVWLSKMLEAKKLSMRKLAKLFGFSSEKNKNENKEKEDKGPKSGNGQRSGHGRKGKDDYTGANKVLHSHDSLEHGDRCPGCGKGKVYDIDPGVFIQVQGRSPLGATVHLSQKLRCNTCGEIFTAELPKELRKQKYDESADVSIAVMKYGLGIALHRLGKWQKNQGIPIAPSTAWERVEWLAKSILAPFNYLFKLASEGELFYIDDTPGKVIDLKKSLKEKQAKRSGIYTTAIVSMLENRQIKLFLTGNNHAGENIEKLLKERPEELSFAIQMSDASANNFTGEGLPLIMALCMSHARRNFKDVELDRPKEVAYVLKLMGMIYKYDGQAKERGLSNEERLGWHKKKSGRVLKKLRRWCLKCFYLKKIEPNEGLGQAIQYLLRHWEGLTEFTRTPGTPLDNNVCERLIKKAILHRKNSLFYKTQVGALVGDMLMSMIATCESLGANAFDYLLTVHRNREMAKVNPENWMPWNFEKNLA